MEVSIITEVNLMECELDFITELLLQRKGTREIQTKQVRCLTNFSERNNIVYLTNSIVQVILLNFS